MVVTLMSREGQIKSSQILKCKYHQFGQLSFLNPFMLFTNGVTQVWATNGSRANCGSRSHFNWLALQVRKDLHMKFRWENIRKNEWN
jgi:hypothetical protein